MTRWAPPESYSAYPRLSGSPLPDYPVGPRHYSARPRRRAAAVMFLIGLAMAVTAGAAAFWPLDVCAAEPSSTRIGDYTFPVDGNGPRPSR